jgi:hypothetical protein
MAVKACGEMVSSIEAYSDIAPDVEVCNRWFNPAISMTRKFRFSPARKAFSKAGIFSLEGHCRSFSPMIASTGHETLLRATDGSHLMMSRK